MMKELRAPGTGPDDDLVRDTGPLGADVALVLSVEQAAAALGIGRTFMYALVRTGAVESVKIGRLRRVPADALREFVRSLRADDHSQAG